MLHRVFLCLCVFSLSLSAHAFPRLCLSLMAEEGSSPQTDVVIGVVDPVSAAAHMAEAVHRITGKKAVAIKTKEYDPDFAATFNSKDPDAELIEIEWPPTLKNLRRLKRAGVTHLLSSFVSVAETQELARLLGLPIMSENPDVLTDKFLQQRVLSVARKPFIPGRKVKGMAEARDAYRDLGPHAIVKPNEGFGGTIDVFPVHSDGQLSNLKEFLDRGALVQKIVPGVEYFVDFTTFFNPLTRKFEHRAVNLARYRKVALRADLPPIYSSIRILPYRGKIQSRIIRQTREALDALQVSFGNSHNEVMLFVEDPEIALAISNGEHHQFETTHPISPIEFNFRMPGGLVPVFAKKYALADGSLNQIDTAVFSAFDPTRLASMHEGWTLKNHLDISFLFAPRAGRFNENAAKALFEKYPGIVKEFIPGRYSQGDAVPITGHLFHSLGKVVIAHPNDAVVTRVSKEIFEMNMRGEFLLPD